jgi:pheromone shutdown-related protein TraB
MRALREGWTTVAEDLVSSDVHALAVGGRDFILVGTAHISRESTDLVRRVIGEEKPDRVCLELDRARYEALSDPQRIESLDLKQIIRQGQLTTLLLNVVLAGYQSQLGGALGVTPGAELLEAARAAQERGIPIELCDRDVRVTLRRAWGALSAWEKLKLTAEFIALTFERPELTEEDLRQLRRQDVVTKLMQELGARMPPLKRVLIDERDRFIAERMRRAEGNRLVGVIGAGHVDGIRQALLDASPVDLAALEVIPPPSGLWRWVGYSIPALIIGSIVMIGVREGAAAAQANVYLWIVANGLPTMLGTLIAGGHPITALSGFVAAPITTLSPLIGAGHVTALVQAYVRPPLVSEMRSATRDFGSPRNWWTNRLLRVFLVFALSTLGAVGGLLFAGSRIVSRAF